MQISAELNGKDLRLAKGRPGKYLVFSEMNHAARKFSGGWIVAIEDGSVTAMPDGLIPTVCIGDFIAGRVGNSLDGFWYQISTGKRRLLCNANSNSYVDPVDVREELVMGRLAGFLGLPNTAAVWDTRADENQPRCFGESQLGNIGPVVRACDGHRFFGSYSGLPTIWSLGGEIESQIQPEGIVFLPQDKLVAGREVREVRGSALDQFGDSILLAYHYIDYEGRYNSATHTSVPAVWNLGQLIQFPNSATLVALTDGNPAIVWGEISGHYAFSPPAVGHWRLCGDTKIQFLHHNKSFCREHRRLVALTDERERLVLDHGNGNYSVVPLFE
jgi:hypothetical protein